MLNGQTDAQIITDFFNAMRTDIIALQQAKGITASGKSAEGLRVDSPDANTYQLIDAEGYFQFEEYGRGPYRGGSGGGGQTLQQRIYDWLQYRKYLLDWVDEKQRLSLSWAIATKIQNQGTLAHIIATETGHGTGVLEEIINADRLGILAAMIKNMASAEILSDVVNEFKK